MKRCRRMQDNAQSPGLFSSEQSVWNNHRRRKSTWSQFILHSIVLLPSTLSFHFATTPQSHCCAQQSRNTIFPSSPSISIQTSSISFLRFAPRRWSSNVVQLQAHRKLGDSALQQVQKLASSVAESTAAASVDRPNNVEGLGGPVYANGQYSSSGLMTPFPSNSVAIRSTDLPSEQVWKALANLERDMQLLDAWTGEKPQLSLLEFWLLSMSVVAAGCSPWLLGGQITEFLAPAAAAFPALIGIGAEYVGKVAVADGKEVAASAIQCAAEAEGLLANAERAKAVTPLCVGIGTTAASFALLVPVLLELVGGLQNLPVVTVVYLCCPLISVLAASVAALALQETRQYCQQATNVGNRRFSKSGLVGRSWLSSTEQIERKSIGSRSKWQQFGFSVFPAPFLGVMVPGSFPTKTIVVAALAAAQAAYFLAEAEYVLSRATDAVAIKARSAAVCDTYANQGARSAAILPFTSALSGLCAAATAAVVELPFLEALAHSGTLVGSFSQLLIITIFPALSALSAAAASVSKARCEIDAEAASQAASTLALEYNQISDDDPVLQPFRGVRELIRLTFVSTIMEPVRRWRWKWRRWYRKFGRSTTKRARQNPFSNMLANLYKR